MSDGTKDVQVNFRCESDLRERAKTHPDLSQSAVWRTGARAVLDGEAIADAEHVNECVFEVMNIYESVLRPIEEKYGDVGLDIAEELREAQLSAAREVTQACYDRVQWAEGEVESLETSTEEATPGTTMSPAEAAHELINGIGEVEPGLLEEGPENLMVEMRAEKCGMDPSEFFAFAIEELADVPLDTVRPHAPDTVSEWMAANASTETESSTGESTPRAATDGGTTR